MLKCLMAQARICLQIFFKQSVKLGAQLAKETNTIAEIQCWNWKDELNKFEPRSGLKRPEDSFCYQFLIA